MKFGLSGSEPKTKQGSCVPQRGSSLPGVSVVAEFLKCLQQLRVVVGKTCKCKTV